MNKIITDAFVARVKLRGAKRLLRYIAIEEKAISRLIKKLNGLKEDRQPQWLAYLRARTRCEYELEVVKNHRNILWSEHNKLVCSIEDEWV